MRGGPRIPKASASEADPYLAYQRRWEAFVMGRRRIGTTLRNHAFPEARGASRAECATGARRQRVFPHLAVRASVAGNHQPLCCPPKPEARAERNVRREHAGSAFSLTSRFGLPWRAITSRCAAHPSLRREPSGMCDASQYAKRFPSACVSGFCGENLWDNSRLRCLVQCAAAPSRGYPAAGCRQSAPADG